MSRNTNNFISCPYCGVSRWEDHRDYCFLYKHKLFTHEEELFTTVTPNSYQIKYKCDNCGHTFFAEIKKGTEAPKHNVLCDHCETFHGKIYI